ncbi:hypothetical protein BbuMM1_E200 (plasmid) [Borreliella burgdorferi]|uniref:Uncharacterized protein n=1 Tax=Borreliella burgdorferi 118a TaxID=476210 RepID=A0A7U4DIT5_BORBG|nr:hypothetical protein Bbu156a_E16 [Borreliella burgdorferi 156a]ACN92821.1 hypothetical protein BBU118A_E16 [Borreliella burgdorferi 118a]AXK69678.1 hypothetical protein BbuMM1_E200 [Borreliella burgdorferi]
MVVLTNIKKLSEEFKKKLKNYRQRHKKYIKIKLEENL